MLRCSKKPYPDPWSAERALLAIQLKNRNPGRKVPTGSYWCARVQVLALDFTGWQPSRARTRTNALDSTPSDPDV